MFNQFNEFNEINEFNEFSEVWIMAKNDDFTSRKIVNFTTGKLFEWLAWLAWLGWASSLLGYILYYQIRAWVARG